MNIKSTKTLTPKRLSVENVSAPEVPEVQNFSNNLKAKWLMMKPLKQHIYLQKIMPYKWNSIFKDDDNQKRKTSADFLDNPQGYLKDLCGDKGVQTLPIASKESLEKLPNKESNLLDDLSLYDEIFTELSKTLPIPNTCDEIKEEPVSSVSENLEASCEKQARYT